MLKLCLKFPNETLKHSLTYTEVQKYGVSMFVFKEINTFIHQGRIKFIKTDSKDIYNVTKDYHFK